MSSSSHASSTSATSASSDERLEQALAEFLHAEERGEPLDSRVWLAAHPDLAHELSSFLENRRAMQRLAAQLPPHELSTAGATEAAARRLAASDEPELPREFGDFELLEELARGGMGIVYRARQRSLQRVVALKMVLAPRGAAHPDTARFRQEAEAAARLEHPHIVPIYEVGEQAGRCYFTMKLIEGGDLNRRLESLSGDPNAAAALVEKVARAVHFAHQHGILHRDLKPANILLDAQGEPLVADFGLARLLDSDVRMTQSGAALGTPGYMAPEQIRGERPTTTAADVYGLGAILYACLTGQAPFQGATAWAAMRQALEGDPPSPRSLNRRVPRDLETICRKALERAPTLRYDSAAALADDLARWLRHEPIAAHPPGLTRRIGKWVRRHPVGSVVLASAACFLGLAAAQIQLLRQANDRAASALYRTQIALAEREWAAGALPFAQAALDQCDVGRRGWEWSFARRLCDFTPANRWGTFPEPLTGGGFSASGHRRCAIDRTGMAWVWDNRGLELARFQVAPREANWLAALAPQDELLAAGAGNIITQFPLRFEPASDKQAAPAAQWTANVSGELVQLAYAPRADRLVALSRDDQSAPRRLTLTLLDLAGQSIAAIELVPATTPLGDFFQFGPDQQLLVPARLASESSKIETRENDSAHPILVFDVRTGQIERSRARVASRAGAAVPPLALSPDGRQVVYLNSVGSKHIEIVDQERGTRHLIPWHEHDAHGFTFSDDSRLLAYITYEMNLEGLRFTQDVPPAAESKTTDRAGHRPDWIHNVHVVDVATGKELSLLRSLPGMMARLRFAPDSRQLLALGGAARAELRGIPQAYGAAVVWDVPERHSARRIRASEQAIRDLKFLGDGRQFATAGDDHAVRIWDSATGALVQELVGHTGPVASLARGANEQELVSAGESEALVWDLTTGKPRRQLAANGQPYRGIHSMAAAPDPAYIALAASSQVVMTRVDSEAPLFHVAQRAQFLSFSPDGRWLAIPQQFDRHGELQLVDVATGRVAKTFRTEPIGLSLRTGWGYLKAAFSPDSRHVAVVGNIGGVHVYDVRSGRRVHTLTGHGVTVWDVAYSSDGTRLATSGYNDRTVKLWSVERGEELHTLRGHDAPVTRVAFAPDDSRLITVDEAGYALIWERGP